MPPFPKVFREDWGCHIQLVRYSGHEFEEWNHNILDFAKRFYKVNKHLDAQILAESVVDYWKREVRHFCKGGEQEEDLLKQVDSPMYDEFKKSKIDSEEQIYNRLKVDWGTGVLIERDEDPNAFVRINWRPTPDELEEDNGVIVVKNQDYGPIIIPEIGLLPLEKLSYWEVSRKIILRNFTTRWTDELMRHLWHDIVFNIYGYVHENEREKKLYSCMNTSIKPLLPPIDNESQDSDDFSQGSDVDSQRSEDDSEQPLANPPAAPEYQTRPPASPKQSDGKTLGGSTASQTKERPISAEENEVREGADATGSLLDFGGPLHQALKSEIQKLRREKGEEALATNPSEGGRLTRAAGVSRKGNYQGRGRK